MNKSETLIKIAPALLKAQEAMGAAKKDASNPFYKSSYADLGAVMEACKKELNDNGILVLQPVGSDEMGVYVETILLHESGEYISDRMRISQKEENNPQAQGSAITYARRYSLQSMVFIPAEDDDAESAMKRPTTPQAKPAQKVLLKEATENDHKCDECGASISEKVSDYSVGRFGKPLCFDDQKKQ